MRSDHRHLTAYQVSCEVGQSIILILRPAVLDRHILAFDVPAFADALPECGHKTCSVGGRPAAKEPDYRHPGLLRARGERPRRGAAEQRDDLAALHSITSSARASSDGGTSRPSMRAVWALMTSSNLADCSTGRSVGLAPLRMRPTYTA